MELRGQQRAKPATAFLLEPSLAYAPHPRRPSHLIAPHVSHFDRARHGECKELVPISVSPSRIAIDFDEKRSVNTRGTMTPPPTRPSALRSLGKIKICWGHVSRDKRPPPRKSISLCKQSHAFLFG